MDHNWCRVLARSSFDGQQWICSDPQENSIQQKLKTTLTELHHKAAEAVAVFNCHSAPEAHITLMAERNGAGYEDGFSLFRYSTQIRVVCDDMDLIMTLIKTESYQHNQKAQVVLKTETDELGEMIWRTPSHQIWDQSDLIKSALKQLVKYSHT